jgi:hypothetical protein
MIAPDFEVHAAASTSTVASEPLGGWRGSCQFAGRDAVELSTVEVFPAELVALGFVAEKCPEIFMCLNNAKILER